MSAGAVRAGAAFVEIFAKDGKFHQAMARMQARMNRMGASMQNVGRNLAMGAAMFGAPMVLAVRQFMAFDDVMRATQASVGLTADELKRVREAALGLSKELGIDPTQVAEGLMELMKAGMSMEDALGGAGKAAIQFSKVAGMPVAETAVVMADAMKNFGESAEQTASTLSAAADSSSTDLHGMTLAFSQVAAMAAQTNQSLGDTSAALAILANAGVKGSDAGTSLKTMLLRLMAPVDEAAEALDRIGLSTNSFRGADQKMLPMVQIIGKLNAAMAGMGQAAKDDVFRKVFGQDAIRAAAILTTAGVEGFSSMRQSMDQALPVGQKFMVMMDGLSGSLQKMWASVSRAAIAFGDVMAPSIKIAATAMQWAGDILGQIIAQFPVLTQIVGGATGGVFALGVAAIAGGFAMKFLAAGIGLLKNAMVVIPALFTPVGLAIMGVSAGIAGAIFLGRQMSPEFKKTTDAIAAALYKLDFKTAWEIMNNEVAIALVRMGAMFDELWWKVKNGVRNAATYVADKSKEMANNAVGWTGWKPFETLGEEGRQELAERRRARAEDGAAGWRATEEELLNERQRLRDRAFAKPEEDAKAKAWQEDDLAARIRAGLEQAKTQVDMEEKFKQPPVEQATAGAGEGVKAATLSGFSSNVQGIGPQLDAAQQTAMATKEMASKLASIDAGVQQAARIAEGQVAKTQIDRDMMTTSEKMLAEIKDQTRVLKDLIREVKNGGVVFA
jgi:TP901 family phage tail tape measure protein